MFFSKTFDYLLQKVFGIKPMVRAYVEIKPPDSDVSAKYKIVFVSNRQALGFSEEKQKNMYEMLTFIGQHVGDKAVVQFGYRGDENTDFEKILLKEWGDKKNQIIESIPALLVIDQPSSSFNPQKHSWMIIKISEFFGEDGKPNENLVQSFTSVLQRILSDETDLFEFLRERERSQKLQKFGSCFKINPGIFGFSFDVKKFVKFYG